MKTYYTLLHLRNNNLGISLFLSLWNVATRFDEYWVKKLLIKIDTNVLHVDNQLLLFLSC